MELFIDRVLAVILALTGFTVEPNPKADRADVLLRYAVEDAHVVLAFDGKVLVLDNYPHFVAAPDRPVVAKFPGAHAELRRVVDLVEQVRPAVRQTLGSDVLDFMGATQIQFFRLPDDPSQPIEALYAARMPKAVALLNQYVKHGGGQGVDLDGRPAIRTAEGMVGAVTDDGILLFGTEALVRPRLAPGWKPPPRPAGSPLAMLATALDARPFFTVLSMPTPGLVARLRDEIGAGFAVDLYAGHSAALVSLSSTGVTFAYQARDPEMAARVKLATEGTIEVLRAMHLLPRSAVQLSVAALPSYAGRDALVDQFLAAQTELQAVVAPLSGDGRFSAKVTLTGNRVTAVARGKKLSDVVPAVALLGLGGVAVILGELDDQPDPAEEMPPRPPPGTIPAPFRKAMERR